MRRLGAYFLLESYVDSLYLHMSPHKDMPFLVSSLFFTNTTAGPHSPQATKKTQASFLPQGS